MKRSIRFAVMLAGAALLGWLLQGPAPAAAQGNVVITPADRTMQAVKRANLRSGPGTSFDKVGMLEIGEQIRVTGETGDWLRVRLSSGRTAFVHAPLLGSAPTKARLGAAAPSSHVHSVDGAHRAVWHLHNVKAGETFGAEKGHYQGSAFAIGPKNFMTALHVVMGVFEKGDSLAAAALEQTGNPVRLKVRRVLSVHVAHDLAVFETDQRVEHYLRFVDGEGPALGEPLFVMGYLDGLRRRSATNGVVYRDTLSFAVMTPFPDLNGMSGSPVVDGGARVVGVAAQAYGLMLNAVRAGYAKALARGDGGVACPQYDSLAACLEAGVLQIERMAADDDVAAIYELGRWDSNTQTIIADYEPHLDNLVAAARKGYPPAIYDLAELYIRSDNLGNAFMLYSRAAEKGHPPSAFELGRFYRNGWGTEADREEALYWLRKSRDQGFLPAAEYMRDKGLR